MLVDIEGCEYNFLLGAKNKIMKYKPIIIIELWSDSKRSLENMKTTQKEMINMIKSMNYNLVGNYGDDFIFEPKMRPKNGQPDYDGYLKCDNFYGYKSRKNKSSIPMLMKY